APVAPPPQAPADTRSRSHLLSEAGRNLSRSEPAAPSSRHLAPPPPSTRSHAAGDPAAAPPRTAASIGEPASGARAGGPAERPRLRPRGTFAEGLPAPLPAA